MLKVIARWLVPGFAVVLGGTALTVFATEANIASDLDARAITALASDHDDWAEIRFDARDGVLTGTAADASDVVVAEQKLASLYGVRSIVANVTVAPLAKPYPFVASVTNGVVTLSGGAPDAATRDLLIAAAGTSGSDLQLRAGMPERAAWLAAAKFAISSLKSLDRGRVELSDLTVSLSGRAKSERAYGDLLLALRQDVPEGLKLGAMTVAPALASPYEWSAQSDGHKISITGFVPDDLLIDRFRTDVPNLPIATGLTLASGQPAAFAEDTRVLLTNLARLDYGSATIIDGHKTLMGAPPNQQVAQAIIDEVKPTGTIVVLEPPVAADFHLGAILGEDGAVKFEGNVPDAATREALGKLPKANAAALSLARGAPQRFQSAVDFALAALQKMSQGRFDIRGNKITLLGVAASVADYAALQDLGKAGAPQGFQLEAAEFAPPPATPYVWSATKAADGKITLAGFVPDPKARAGLLATIKTAATDNAILASGEPKRFVSSAVTGLSLLNSIATGKLAYDGAGWTLSGQSRDAAGLATLQAAFVAQGLAGAGWTMSVTGPEPAPISPYTWSAIRDASGVTFTGYVPEAALQKALVIRAGQAVVDKTVIGAGAPADFATAVRAGLDALMTVETGTLKFDGTRWTFMGIATNTVHDAVLASLAEKVEIAAWTVDIAVPKPVVPAAPYVWSATRTADGGIKLAGSVPTESLQRFEVARAGKVTSDTTVIVAPAPEGFINDVLAALDALAELNAGIVSFDGKKWSISGELRAGKDTTAVDTALAAASTPAKDWLKELATKLPEPVAQAPVEPEKPVTPAMPKADPNYSFTATRDPAGVTVLTGQVPADPARRYFGAVSGGSIDGLVIAPNAPEDFLISTEAGLRALLLLSEGRLSFATGVWSLSGKAVDQKTKDIVAAAIAALPNGANWKLDVAAPPVLDVCREAVTAFMANNTILFQSGAALIADESQPALDDLATDLALCPDNVVQIEGHTDADGDDNLNLALSVARAESVVNALISRNILAARLYAVGYGETKPIASNETTAGKRQNRRIVISVLDEHY
ncbi:OmpA family protein [Devosia sp.]|uniref:OmpA family protein n=1 Tax=Devosia sp. TaxID=1871048 RepID=UPI0032655889